jgi:C1A family cysteine protease
MEIKRKYNLRFDEPHEKDYYYKAPRKTNPNSVNLVEDLPKHQQCPYDQGKLGSCTANSVVFMYAYYEIKQKNNDLFMPSRLFVYYNARKLFGDPDEDTGASIKQAIKSLAKYGVCEEKYWPYDASKVLVCPKTKCYKQAKECKVIAYARVDQALKQLKITLNKGNPIGFGFQIYKSFETNKVKHSGVYDYKENDEKSIGGHAVILVGYDDEKQMFMVRNSWGSDWSDDGYFWLPYKFVTNSEHCNDFWIITSVSDPNIVKGNYVNLKPVDSEDTPDY